MQSERLSAQQYKSLAAAWLGWAFDGLDGFLYIIVGIPFVAQLLKKPPTDPEVAPKAALIQACFLFGWAIGGVIFGRLGDRLGRARTLTLTVLTYACFTGLSFFATHWWHLLVFRFIAALGIGGEWAAGSALVCETLPKRHRHWASATLQSGYMIGLEPRYVFLVGVIPAFLTVWIRHAVPEPDEWKRRAAAERPPPVRRLFTGGLLKTTVLTIALTGIALTTVWAFLFFLTPAIRNMPDVKEWKKAEVDALIADVTVAYLAVNIVGNFFATYLARTIGHRVAFALLFAASLACFLVGFRGPLSLSNVYWISGACAFFALGIFGLFPLYIPPLFPTMLRTLGAGITYNIGRVISGIGTLVAGTLLHRAGDATVVLWWVGLLFIPGVLVALVVPQPVEVVTGDAADAPGGTVRT